MRYSSLVVHIFYFLNKLYHFYITYKLKTNMYDINIDNMMC